MRRYRGYMSLEAALIMPMVICVLTLLIYFTYYLYGRCIITEDSYILAFRATISDKGGKEYDPEGYVMEKASEITGKKYFGSRSPSFKVEENGKDIRVVGTDETRHRAMGRYFLKPDGSWSYMAAGKATRRQYTRHIRMLTRLKDLGRGLIDLGE